MSINNNNNNGNAYKKIKTIRESNTDCKIEFVSTVISQNGVPSDFQSIGRSKKTNIFFEINKDETIRREWIFFLDNKFYCVYCLCFSPLNSNRLVLGVEYVKGCRITEKLCTHGKELNHKAAKNVYTNIVAKLNGEEVCNEKRSAVKCIVKIIIFIATHGECFIVVMACC